MMDIITGSQAWRNVVSVAVRNSDKVCCLLFDSKSCAACCRANTGGGFPSAFQSAYRTHPAGHPQISGGVGGGTPWVGPRIHHPDQYLPGRVARLKIFV